MTAPRTLAPLQQLLSFALAALLTSGVLLSLAAQADDSHAGAVLAAQSASGQQLCAAPGRASRT